jgi:hypothetical protein
LTKIKLSDNPFNTDFSDIGKSFTLGRKHKSRFDLDVSDLFKPEPFWKTLERAKKTAEKAGKLLNKYESKRLACVARAKSIPENATIRKEYVKCRKYNCRHERHGPYYYAYWKEGEKLRKKYIGGYFKKGNESANATNEV